MESKLGDFVQVGTIGIRDPNDRYRIIKNIPIYEEVTHVIQEQNEETYDDVAKLFAEKFRKYIEGQEVTHEPKTTRPITSQD